jgi:hypothetical protein
MSFLRSGRLAALSLGAGLIAASPVAANQFVGDLVYCDTDANGRYDGADYTLDGVQVRVTCTDTAGTVCFDSVATTGALHPSVTPSVFDTACSSIAGYSATGDLAGRYLVEVLGANGALPGCTSPTNPRPYECVVTVDESTLPETCNGLVTPVAGLPDDGNGDGDWCDPEDGPFPEGQVLGDNSTSQASCEASPSPGPGEGVHTTVSFPAPGQETWCSLYADFGYTPKGGEQFPTRTPGFWKNHPSALEDTLPVAYCGETITEICDAVTRLRTPGGGFNAWTRHVVAAALNCAAFDCPDDIADLIAESSAACAGQSKSYDFGAAAALLDEYNNSGDALPSDLDQSPADPKYCGLPKSGSSHVPHACRNPKHGHPQAKRR